VNLSTISPKRFAQLTAVIKAMATDNFPSAMPGARSYIGSDRPRLFHATVYPGYRVTVSRRGTSRYYEVVQ
jgi:hypothetical protein